MPSNRIRRASPANAVDTLLEAAAVATAGNPWKACPDRLALSMAGPTLPMKNMLDFLSLFLVTTLVAGVFGFVGHSGSVEGIAQSVFALFAWLSVMLIILIRYRPSLK